MKDGEANYLVAAEKYISHKGVAADSQELNTRLFYDLNQLGRHPPTPHQYIC